MPTPDEVRKVEFQRILQKSLDVFKGQEDILSTIGAVGETREYRDPSQMEYKQAVQDIELESKRAEVKYKKDLNAMRKTNANVLRWFSISWTAAVIGIVVLNGFLHTGGWEFVSDTVLLTLIGTTTANVLALYGFVIKSIFPSTNR